MKTTQDGKTLFQALAEKFTTKIGHMVNRRAFGDYASLVAHRNNENQIVQIEMVLRPKKDETEKCLLSVFNQDNRVFLDAHSWPFPMAMNRLNKALALVGLNIKQRNGSWVIEDSAGQITTFQHGKNIDLSRPHGAAIYPTQE